MKRLMNFMLIAIIFTCTAFSCDNDSDDPQPVNNPPEVNENLIGVWNVSKIDIEDKIYFSEGDFCSSHYQAKNKILVNFTVEEENNVLRFAQTFLCDNDNTTNTGTVDYSNPPNINFNLDTGSKWHGEVLSESSDHIEIKWFDYTYDEPVITYDIVK